MEWGGGFLGEFSVAKIIFFNAFIHHEFFSGAFSCIRCFFFCLQHGEITTIHYYSIQFLQHSHISERFRVGVGTKRSKLSLAAWEFDVVLEIENPRPKKNWTYVRKLSKLSKFSLVTKFGDFIIHCLLNCTTENLRRSIYGILVLSLFLWELPYKLQLRFTLIHTFWHVF